MPGISFCPTRFWMWIALWIPFIFAVEAEGTISPCAQHSFVSAASLDDRVIGSGVDWPRPWFRWGEALNPGPTETVHLGTSNPSGLRSKELIALGLGPGLWFFTETQLSTVTQRSVQRALQHGARQAHRHVRITKGAPAPLRRNSEWAGAWTGVLSMSDFPAREIRLTWPDMEYSTGRILVTEHHIGTLPITAATIYGYAQGPTYPSALALTDGILRTITKEVVLGRGGPRVIVGDFNASPDELEQCQLWRARGWIECQDWAHQCWQIPIRTTCKNATRRDFIWMSPEAAALCSDVQVNPHFMEHDTVQISLKISRTVPMQLQWIHPAQIPWSQVNQDILTTSQPHMPDLSGTDVSSWYSSLGKAFEAAVHSSSSEPLPGRCRGRCQATSPKRRPAAKPLTKPSRNGEVTLYNDLTGWAVAKWFKQLRRLQSLRFALLSPSSGTNADEHRWQLWNRIRNARGFSGNFVTWWPTRPVQHQGSPVSLHNFIPNQHNITMLYDDFHANFRKFEAWHARQRNKVITARFEAQRDLLFKSMRKPQAPEVDLLIQENDFIVLAQETETGLTHLDQPASTDSSAACWDADGETFRVQQIDGDIIQVADGFCLTPGQAVSSTSTISVEEKLHDAFLEEWTQRWNSHSELPEEVWDRALAFGMHFLPSGTLEYKPIASDEWEHSLSRLRPNAAKGPDSLSKEDLRRMPQHLKDQILSLYTEIEQGRCEWPANFCRGR